MCYWYNVFYTTHNGAYLNFFWCVVFFRMTSALILLPLNLHFKTKNVTNEDVAYTRYPLLRYFCGIFLAVLFTINLVFHVVSLFFL